MPLLYTRFYCADRPLVSLTNAPFMRSFVNLSKIRPTIAQSHKKQTIQSIEQEMKQVKANKGKQTSEQKSIPKIDLTFFKTSKPIVLADNGMFFTGEPLNLSKKYIRSLLYANLGLLFWLHLAFWYVWSYDLLLPALYTICLSSFIILLKLGCHVISKLTLLPNYRLRFDRFGYFMTESMKNSVEFDLKDIRSVTFSNKMGWLFFTPLCRKPYSIPLIILELRTVCEKREYLNALVTYFQQQSEIKSTQTPRKHPSVSDTENAKK